jgi:hypothetical protein
MALNQKQLSLILIEHFAVFVYHHLSIIPRNFCFCAVYHTSFSSVSTTMASSGASWSQLRQQTRSAESQVCLVCCDSVLY